MDAQSPSEPIDLRAIAPPGGEPEGFFRGLVEHSPDLIVLVDREAHVRYAGPALTALLGYKPEEILGAWVFDLLHPEDAEVLAIAFAEGIGVAGPTPVVEVRAIHKDGSERWFEAVTNNLIHHAAVGGFVTNLRDITECKRGEEPRPH